MMNDNLSLIKPSQTVLVGVSGKASIMGKERNIDNLITIDWHMPTSFNPFLYVISVGKTRFSLNLLKKSRVFSVNFMSYEYKKQVVYCGQKSGIYVDKYKETGLTAKDCEKIDAKYVSEALAVLECEVIEEIETGDHVIFIGKVLYSKEFKKGKRLMHISENEFTTTMK